MWRGLLDIIFYLKRLLIKKIKEQRGVRLGGMNLAPAEAVKNIKNAVVARKN